MNTNSIADIRKSYTMGSFNETDAHENAMEQFNIWWQQALASEILEVNALTLATVDSENKPHARIVLLKGFNDAGFVFYTNYHSNKGKDLAQNPSAALVIFWKELERQIRIEGTITQLSAQESDDYFYSRPLESQIGAISSPQSQIIPNRAWLEEKEAALKASFAQNLPKRPENWGGYRVKPSSLEFWQGRPSRLHDRIKYSLINEDQWKIERLAP
jgi:pyridoxamine 5'-phosphate oxidase